MELFKVRPGDTSQSIAQGLPYDDFRHERFLVLNGLSPGQPLTPGQRVKIIARKSNIRSDRTGAVQSLG